MFARKIEVDQEQDFEGLAAARQYAVGAQKSTLRYRTFLERLDTLGVTGRYLDVGAGPGHVAGMIAQKYPQVKVTALELSPDMAAVGQELLKSNGLDSRVNFVVGDAADTGLLQSLGKFDLIYSTYSLHHWENPRQVIDNLLTILADDGVLFIHDLRRVWWLYWAPSQNGFFRSIRGAYLKEELEAMLAGFSPECYEVKNEIPFLLSVIIKKSTF
ncbi:MAG: class I SAM-dependent methyltransferase [Anaerolineae bacterium]|nr:class I SAM-dependent methyltransferase [Anaerolineae bacterium]